MENMNDTEQFVRVLQATFISTLVADFLLNTGRVLKGIALCKECLILINTYPFGRERQFGKIIYGSIYSAMFRAYCCLPDYTNAIKYGRELLVISRECGEKAEANMNGTEQFVRVLQATFISTLVADILLNTGRVLKGIALCKECLILINTNPFGKETQFGKIIYGSIYSAMFRAYCCLPDYTNAIKYGRELLVIFRQCGETAEEGKLTMKLGDIYKQQGEYAEARKLYERAINITIETGEREGQAHAYQRFGAMSYFLGEFVEAQEYIGRARDITTETGNRVGEATCYVNLGIVFKGLGEYDRAKEYLDQALAFAIEIADRETQAGCYLNLGIVFTSLGEYDKAKDSLHKAVAIDVESGDRAGEASCYIGLGIVFQSLGEYDKTKEYLQKALAITTEIGDRAGQAHCYGELGTVFQSLGEYDIAKKHLDIALVIRTKIGDKAGKAKDYGKRGTLFQSLSEYGKAKECFENALAIMTETGDRGGEARCYGNLGALFLSLREYDKAKEYLDKALYVKIEIGDREGQAADYGALGTLFQYLGEYNKAKIHFEKELAIALEIGHRSKEAVGCINLGGLFYSLGEHVKAESYLERALLICKDTRDADVEFCCFCNLTMVKLSLGKMEEAFQYLTLSFKKSEKLRGFLRNNDQFKTAWSDAYNFPYRNLSAFFCFSGNPNNALYVLELARARALADVMATQYFLERQITADPKSWIGIENIMKKESNCACLYISYSYYYQVMFLWILKTSGVIHFQTIAVNENITGTRLFPSLEDILAKSFCCLGILPQIACEDRTLNGSEPEPKLSPEENLSDLRLVEEDDDDDGNQDPKQGLLLLYKMIIAPVADLLEELEMIIVPDRSLFQVPFAALTDRNGKYLSDTFRIRIVPSLTALKLIQDSPADYHCQTGALIVGDPVVGPVRYKGRVENFKPLPCARKEAEMIGKLLGIQPLLGECATKQAVLERVHSVSLIHFAAHGNAERGEIALSPVHTAGGISQEEDYLLTMADISKVRLRAKLVVLSCCHSGCGQVRAEGVIGIARAFLGSGARSVLVALWAIDDKATEMLMLHFYEHLVRGESASESLHKTMKWMRGNGFTEVSQWAPFMLIGDDVAFDFGK